MNLHNRFVIDRSNNHAHLTKKDAITLFGINPEFTLFGLNPEFLTKPLAIEGEYSTDLKIKDYIGNSYTVLYPWRPYSQLELAASDFYKIVGSYPERVNSGEVEDAVLLKVTGTRNSSVLINTITVKAHVHIACPTDYFWLQLLDFPFKLSVKRNLSTDGLSHIHLDKDQYAAIQGL